MDARKGDAMSILNEVTTRLFVNWRSSLAGLGIILTAVYGHELAPEDQKVVTDTMARAAELLGLVLMAWKSKA
jgi:hypothetical protein